MDIFLQLSGALTTILAGLGAIFLFYLERSKKKKDAAKIIIQEIRRAEEIINDYKESNLYHFTKKIIATNSWGKNLHFFVSNLDQDEIDKISNLYSTGEYLDSVIKTISDFQLDLKFKEFNEQLDSLKKQLQTTKSAGDSKDTEEKAPKQAPVTAQIQIPTPWKELLDIVTYKYEPIYHSSILEKLKSIAKK